MERRTLLKQTLGSLIGLIGVGSFLSGCGKEKKPTPTGPDSNTVDLDLTDATYTVLRDVGGAMKVNLVGVSNPVLVIRKAQDQISVLSTVCTHAGCEVGLPQNSEIACPCHGSKYDLDGLVLQGPATQSLPSYQAVIQNQIISITV